MPVEVFYVQDYAIDIGTALCLSVQTQVEQEHRWDNETSGPSSATLLSCARCLLAYQGCPTDATVLIIGETGTGASPNTALAYSSRSSPRSGGAKEPASASRWCGPS